MTDDTPAFTEQAKWLIDRHLRRSENLATRAAALLGFTGVTLALLLQGIQGFAVDANAWTWTSLILTTAALLTTAFCCIKAISTSEVTIQGSKQLRGWWDAHRKDPKVDVYARNIAESFLNSTNLDDDSPIDSAMKQADRRARWFTRAIWSLLAALCLLATLMFETLIQT